MTKSVISTGHILTSQVAEEILKVGGNAFDAVVGAAIMASVSEPLLCSLGGGGYMLAKTSDGQHCLYDFFVNFPGLERTKNKKPNFVPVEVQFTSATQVFYAGGGSIAVPGCLKGYVEIQKELGRIPLREVISAVVDQYGAGVELNKTQAYVIKILDPIMRLTEAGKQIYELDGQLLKAGESVVNPCFIDFIKELPNGIDREFYEGEIAKKMVSDLSEFGQIGVKDFAHYEVMERMPHISHYRDYKLYTTRTPCTGGELTALLLKLLEPFDLKNVTWGSEEHLSILKEVMQKVEELKEKDITDLSEAECAEMARNINTFTKGTTHLSVADKDMNFASMSISNGEGSGYFAPGTGVMLNNMLGEDDLCPEDYSLWRPGERMISMMSPCILEKDPTHNIVIGSGGSKRIRSSLMQVISNIVDFNMNMSESVDAPRVNWDGNALQVEPGFDQACLKNLEKKFVVNSWPEKEFYFGGAHGVIPGVGARGDSRREGHGIIL